MRGLRSRAYDAVIDTQGLFLKSALLARAARGRRHGYDPNSIKEPFACMFYNVRHAVEWKQHAIARNRALTGAALGYTPKILLNKVEGGGAVPEPAEPMTPLISAAG